MKTERGCKSWVALFCLAALLFLAGCQGGGGDGPPPNPSPGGGGATAKTLNITPIYQETEVWCWAAAATMVFRYYGLPNVNIGGDYQCGVVAVTFPNPCAYNCLLCQTGIETLTNLNFVIDNYGYTLTNFYFIPSRNLSSQFIFSALTMDQVVGEINANRPILVGISPSGFVSAPNVSEHVAVIIGYDTARSELVVNDPYPFALFPGRTDPYVAAGGRLLRQGQYAVPYNGFVYQMLWANTIYQIQ